MNFNELKTVLRTQKRNKLTMLINLLGLTIGIASVAVIAAFVVSELNRGKEIPNAQNIYRIESDTEFGHIGLTPYPLGNYLKNKFGNVIDFVNQADAFTGTNGLNTLENGDEKYIVKNLFYADSSYFKIFKHKPISGDLSHALDNPNGLILTKGESLRIFGNTDPVGKTVKLDNNRLLEVEAVIEDIPEDALNYFQSVASLQGKFQAENISYEERWVQFDFFCYFQLSPNADLVKLEKETSTVLNERFAKKIGMDFTNKVSFIPYSDLYFHEPSILEHLKHGSFQTVMV
ncbi:MAG: ABC transporter permease, partial [Bacteroidales bacterium]|nr:ABC transporter permease [Bacteroidales bacterium]